MFVSLLLLPAALLSATPPRPDPATLPAQQRAVFDRVVSEEFCGCSSALTLGGCLQMRPTCRIADHLGHLTLRLVESDLKGDEILTFLSDRVMAPFCAKQLTLSTTGAPSKGPAAAPVTIVEFADFRCGHCRAAAPLLKAAARANPGARFVFIPFPLRDHPMSVAAAEAALAGEAQGKFWPMHDALFELQHEDFGPDVLKKAARKAGLDLNRFGADMASHKYRSRVMALKQLGTQAGVMGTPSFYVNGRPYEVDTVVHTFTDRIAMEADRTRGKCQ